MLNTFKEFYKIKDFKKRQTVIIRNVLLQKSYLPVLTSHILR